MSPLQNCSSARQRERADVVCWHFGALPEEAAHIASVGRSLTELQGIGPTLARHLNGWFESPPSAFEPPPIRREFLTLAQARRILAKNPEGKRLLQGDLQMHTVWSDGSGTISAMAEAAIERDYK